MNGPTYDQLLAVFEAAKNNGSGHQVPRDDLPIIDWSTSSEHTDELIPSLAIPGRWTAIAAAAKAGKSSLLISMSVEVSEGRHPFDGTPVDAARVLYLDAEMGRLDMEERLVECGYVPVDLKNWWACDIPPRLDSTVGAALVLEFVRVHDIQMVVIDGLNGVVGGAEKDDTPWRLLFEHIVRPLKELGVAVITADNLGKDAALGPRGSSVKLDKADAVLNLTRTQAGVNLHASHRRTAAYLLDLALDALGIEGDEPLRYRYTAGQPYPEGTKEVAELLDELGVDPTLGRDAVRKMLRRLAAVEGDEQRYRVRNGTLSAAIRWRKEVRMHLSPALKPTFGDQHRGQVDATPSDQGGQVAGTAGTGDETWMGTAGGVVDTPGPNRPANDWDEEW
jgi:hypothetical protein